MFNLKPDRFLLLIPILWICGSGLLNASEKEHYLRKIIIDQDSVLTVPLESQSAERFFSSPLKIHHGKNNIGFILNEKDSAEYQYFLSGFDRKWTGWREENFKEYTNVPPGKYEFHARIRNTGNVTQEESLQVVMLPPWYSAKSALVIYMVIVIALIMAVYDQVKLNFAYKQYQLEQIINKRTEDLIIEKEKSEALLANVLPKNTASEIMAKGKATKIKYNFVTVLFSDIQGFTKIAEEMNPEVLIDELDKFFFHFDSVVEKYGIEKIKTIGDAYMCAGGIPEKNRTNPVEVILAALEMQTYMNRLKETSELQGMKYWDIRIGIHTGTVVAGVVGQKKLSYDIWGDTVNTASRMESSGEAGKINISGTTYEFVKDFFECEFRGKMPVKYKGEIEMYFVNGIAKGLSDENGLPNKCFVTKMQMIKLHDIEDAVIKLFEDEASPNLYFHNSSLVKNIVSIVDLLANSEEITEEDYIELKIAAIFLFAGYIYDYENPEEASVRLAEEMLPGYGFGKETIDSAVKVIRNSYQEVEETPKDMILHDARYDYLGRVDYPRLTEKLLRERTEYGQHFENRNWLQLQKRLLKGHDFRTKTAQLLRNISIAEQLAGIEKK
jgi:class 3 adenylate cyclase